MLDWSCLHVLTAELHHATVFSYMTAHSPSEQLYNISLSSPFSVALSLFPAHYSKPVLNRVISFIKVFFMTLSRCFIKSHEFDFSVTIWGEGMLSPPHYRWGTEARVLKVCSACRRSSREGWHLNFQSCECNTDLSDPKISTGFRCISEHSEHLKIGFHIKKKQNIQYINDCITNFCCFHV